MKLTVFFYKSHLFAHQHFFVIVLFEFYFYFMCEFFYIIMCKKNDLNARIRNTWICKILFFWTYFLVGRVKIHSEFCAQVSFFFFQNKSVDISCVVSTAIFRYQKCKLNGFGRQRSFIYVSRETRDCTTKQFFFICICISICSVQFIYFMLFFSFYYYCYDYNNYCYFNFMLLVAFVKKTMIKSRRKTHRVWNLSGVHMWGEHSEHTWIYIYIYTWNIYVGISLYPMDRLYRMNLAV